MKYFICAKPRTHTFDHLRIGAIHPEVLPANTYYEWLECDGKAVSRREYAELFLRVGTSFGGGDGITTFNLPTIKIKV
jgi:hypothetical protein